MMVAGLLIFHSIMAARESYSVKVASKAEGCFSLPAQREGRHALPAYENGSGMSLSRASRCHFFPCVRM